jgi:hypothetical protein
MIRDFKGTIERENAAIGIFITLIRAHGAMRKKLHLRHYIFRSDIHL